MKYGMLGKKIVIVDDEEFNLFLLENVLVLEGAEVISKRNAKDVLELFEENNNIDVILTDLMMPEMDGYDLMDRLQESDFGKNIPIIALSANMNECEEAKCKSKGVVSCLSKPINVEKLIRIINNVNN